MLIYIIQKNRPISNGVIEYKNQKTYRTVASLEEQARRSKIDIDIIKGVPADIPTRIKDDYILIIEENMLIHDDYLIDIVSSCMIHRDMSVLCGPVYNSSLEDSNSGYMEYNINPYSYSTIHSFHLGDEVSNYPDINNVVFSGLHYNSLGGYRREPSTRGFCTNYGFLSSMAKQGKVIYSESISSIRYEPMHENSKLDLSNYYLRLGYENAMYNRNDTKLLHYIKDFPTYALYYNVGKHEYSAGSRVV